MTGRPAPAEPSRTTCARCGEPLKPGDLFCAACGTPAAACGQCGTVLGPTDRFCPRCGTGVGVVSRNATPRPQDPAAEDANPWALVISRLQAATRGEFEILRELGRGGMATVYLAHEVALNRKVAIKVMSPALLTGEGMVRRFRQEAITVANMSHQHIITIHAVRQIEDLHFFVMKFVEGRSLEHILRATGPLPIRTVRGLLWMVGSALAYAHRRGVVHRDVKPANILVDEEGNAVVTDFGIAKMVARDAGVPRTSLPGETQTGFIVGTPTYMSPEQCLARPVSAASDQYSLGLVAHELLTGRPPFTGSPFVVMHAHTEKPAPPIRELRPDCDPELDDAVLRMLAKEPAQRWPSIQHALAALGAAPLGDGDPARTELAALSIPAPYRRSDEVLRAAPAAPTAGTGAPRAEPTPYVAMIEIFAPPPVVEVGDTFTLTGSPRNAAGDTTPGARLRWSSSDERVATVDETRGAVTARAPGDVEIAATVGGSRNAVHVTVVPKRVAAINVSLPPGALHAGDRVQLVATPRDKRLEAMPAAVHWASGDESIASVGTDGVVSAKAPGEVLVWAESDGVRGTARLEVTPVPVVAIELASAPPVLEVGESAELRAMPLDARRRRVADRPVRWTSSDPAIAEVMDEGTVYARSVGVARLVCACDGITASADLAVITPVVAKILIEPPPARVDLGLPVKLRAEASSARGVRLDRPISWRSESPRIASVDANGVAIPLRAGTARIVAAADGVEESVGFDVNPPVLTVPDNATPTQMLEFDEARRMLERSDPRLPIGEVEAAAASAAHAPREGGGRGAPGARLAGAARLVIAQVIARVGPRRLAIAAAAAPALVLVVWLALPRRRASPAVVSSGAPAAADSARPSSSTTDSASRAPMAITIAALRPIRVGDSVTAQATVTGDTSASPGPMTWTSSAARVARVNPRTGRVVGVGEGTASLTVEWGSATATIPVRVLPAPAPTQAGRGARVPVARLVATEVKSALREGDTMRLTAAPLDARGGSLVDRAVSWRSERPAIASVDAGGLVTARRVGTTAIVATSEAQSVRIPVSVVARPAPDPGSMVRAAVDECVAAMANRDVQRLIAVYAIEGPTDRANLDWLTDKVRRPDAALRVRQGQTGELVVHDAEASMQFALRLSWRAPSGESRDRVVVFLARANRNASGWQAARARAVDRLE